MDNLKGTAQDFLPVGAQPCRGADGKPHRIGQRLEVEFFSDGQIELERFGPSSGVTSTTLAKLTGLLDMHAD
jgi:hypothetical protein